MRLAGAIKGLQVGVPTLAVVVAVAWPLAGAGAQSPYIDMPEGEAYRSCTALVRDDPELAFEEAVAWRDLGGGVAARHCVAIALVELGHPEEAAQRLERLAEDMGGYPIEVRATVLGQAGRAWLEADRMTRAYAAVSAGLVLDPENVELIIDRSEVLAAAANYWEALDDLNRALELAPDRIDALVFRAVTYRFLDALDLASDDLERALDIDADNPEALVERGIVRRLNGDGVGARADWLATLRLAPDSFAAEVARNNLAKLDVDLKNSSAGADAAPE